MVTKLFGILLILSFFVLWGISLNKHEQPVPINTVLTREQTKPYNPDIPIVENWKIILTPIKDSYWCNLKLTNQERKATYELEIKWVWKLDRASFVRRDGVVIGYITGINGNTEIYYKYLDELNKIYKKKNKNKYKLNYDKKRIK
mgnify:CR=1 FL=1